MFSQRNNPYCELLELCSTKVEKNFNILLLFKNIFT